MCQVIRQLGGVFSDRFMSCTVYRGLLVRTQKHSALESTRAKEPGSERM